MKLQLVVATLLVAANLILVGPAEGWKPRQEPVASVADRFVASLQSCDAAEREQLNSLAWNSSCVNGFAFSQPRTINEGFFSTDVDGVQGFRRILELTVSIRIGATYPKTYCVEAYPDRRTGAWKVWSFQECADPVATQCRLRFDDHPSAEAQNLIAYGDCLSRTGRLTEAVDAYRAAANLADQMKASCDRRLDALRQIIGR